MTPASTKDDRGLRHAKAGVFVFLIGIVLALWLSSMVAPRDGEAMAPDIGNLPTRDTLIKKARGMTPDQALSAFGRPARTDRYDKLDYAAWHYDKPFSYDPIAMRKDEKMNLHFRDGVVDSLTF